MLCNYAEYKKMDQDVSLGQLYNAQDEINILYKALGWAYSFSMTQGHFCQLVTVTIAKKYTHTKVTVVFLKAKHSILIGRPFRKCPKWKPARLTRNCRTIFPASSLQTVFM
jgi:hypothetical protein